MIIFKDILKLLRERGYTTYRLRKEKWLSESTIDRIRKGKSLSTDTIDTICSLTGLNIEDVIEYRPDNLQ